MKKIMIIASMLCMCMHQFAQERISKREFDDLWNRADSVQKLTLKTGNPTKVLNSSEKENIQNIDPKEKTVTNPNYKLPETKDTLNKKEYSTEPIIKGVTKTKTKGKTIEETPAPVTTAPVIAPPKTPVNIVPPKTETKTEPKKNFDNEDFSTHPIVKGKRIEEQPAQATQPNKPKMDTTKDARHFTFEGTPIVNGNASYNRKNEPMPKTAEEVDDEIPVNRKPNNTNVEKDNTFLKAAYAQYDKEADSLHTANKRVLDSVMKALKIKVPVIISSTDFIDIYVSGGGLLENNSSKIYDHISILNTGTVQREYKTKADGVQRTQKKITRDELTKLAQYIVDMGFFDFQNEYDCADGDAACNARFGKSPQPVPLEVSVTVGERKNKVKATIYAPKEKNWVSYPSSLEKIMTAIYTIVEK